MMKLTVFCVPIIQDQGLVSLETQFQIVLYICYSIPLLGYTMTDHVRTVTSGSTLLRVDGSHCFPSSDVIGIDLVTLGKVKKALNLYPTVVVETAIQYTVKGQLMSSSGV